MHTPQGDVFSYLLSEWDDKKEEWTEGTEPRGGVLGTLFAAAWYNDDPYSPDEQGYLYDYNRLIGGVLIVQVVLYACYLRSKRVLYT
jgi:hypothetical protein